MKNVPELHGASVDRSASLKFTDAPCNMRREFRCPADNYHSKKLDIEKIVSLCGEF